jgi:hypothetical protein
VSWKQPNPEMDTKSKLYKLKCANLTTWKTVLNFFICYSFSNLPKETEKLELILFFAAILECLFETFFILINTQLLMLMIHIEICTCLHVKCLLFMSDFNPNCKVLKNVIETPHYQIS